MREQMNKGIEQVRKSISKRKEQKRETLGKRNVTTKAIMPSIPQEEERHGYYPMMPANVDENLQSKHMNISGFVLKGVLAVILFLITAFIWQTDSSKFNKIKNWTSYALEEDFPFAKVNHWYQETFGDPLALSPPFMKENENVDIALPVNGDIAQSFQANGKGILISTDELTNVTALHEGVVVFAGKKKDTKNTVIVQHVDGSKSTYGYLSEIDVHLYQAVQVNHKLGEFSPTDEEEMVYFSIEKNNEYIDPIQVIKVDDNP